MGYSGTWIRESGIKFGHVNDSLDTIKKRFVSKHFIGNKPKENYKNFIWTAREGTPERFSKQKIKTNHTIFIVCV